MPQFDEASDDAIQPIRRPRRLTRRVTLLGLAAAGVAAFSRVTPSRGAARETDTASRADWQAFSDRFITADGRVVDTGNGGVTHTEGQGYALLFAEHFADRAMFDRVLGWTQRTLGRSGDALHAWQYRPDATVPVSDRNNATDGDLLIAWALLRAGQRWGDDGYSGLGRAMAGDLLRWCTREVAGLTVLLPGSFGFDDRTRVVVNPSYYVFPALDALAEAAPDPAWARLRADGSRLLRAGRFGPRRLPADWLEIRDNALDTLAPAQGWPARFSWDAVRVPLNFVWAGLENDAAIDGVADFWGSHPGRAAAWASLTTEAVAPFPASLGVTAIARVLRAARGGGDTATGEALSLPRVADAEDYYSAALMLQARIVWRERSGRLAEV